MATLKPLRVVVVDDDRDTADTLVWLLQMAGHEAVGCYAGGDAIEQACVRIPDVMLIDMAMPGMDGNQVPRQVRQSAHTTKTLLIAMTGYADEAHHKLGIRAGFDHYLVKPVEFPALCGLLDGRKGRAPPDYSRS